MSYAKTHILVAEGAYADNTAFVINAAGSPVSNAQPPNPVDFGSEGSEVTFQVSVAEVIGAPSAWSLGVKFQYCLAHTTGYQYQKPVWFDLSTDNLETNVVEGVGWYSGSHPAPLAGEFGIVADQTDTLRVTVQRTIQHFGVRTRLLLNPQFTGGTTPGLKCTILANVKS